MSVPSCRRCRTPLKRTQGLYCSPGCMIADRRPAPRNCPQCGRPLTRLQLKKRVVCCSRACRSDREREHPIGVRAVVLDILRGNRHAWLTSSDLAIWAYGFDDQMERGAVRQLIYKLRRRGYRIANRRATWEQDGRGSSQAYRLVSEPSAQRKGQAA